MKNYKILSTSKLINIQVGEQMCLIYLTTLSNQITYK